VDVTSNASVSLFYALFSSCDALCTTLQSDSQALPLQAEACKDILFACQKTVNATATETSA